METSNYKWSSRVFEIMRRATLTSNNVIHVLQGSLQNVAGIWCHGNKHVGSTIRSSFWPKVDGGSEEKRHCRLLPVAVTLGCPYSKATTAALTSEWPLNKSSHLWLLRFKPSSFICSLGLTSCQSCCGAENAGFTLIPSSVFVTIRTKTVTAHVIPKSDSQNTRF